MELIEANLKLISKLLLVFWGIILQLNENIIAFPSVFGWIYWEPRIYELP